LEKEIPMADIQFHSLVKSPGLRDRKRLKEYLNRLFKKEGKKLISLQYILCSDDYLLKINQIYLHHDFYTDIVSFDLGDPSKGVEGEIYISIDRVRENAQKFNASLKEELYRVIFHGALHLCGYKDKLKRDQLEMRAKENRLLEKYLS
jgi:probable rRNA maturation factor